MASEITPMKLDTTNRVVVSYLLWALGWTGFSGLHRIYNGKIASGVLWLCTFGLFGVGQIIDLFLMIEMAEAHQVKQLVKQGALASTGAIAPDVISQTTRDEMILKLLREAEKTGGAISVTQGVLATGLNFSDVECVLNELHRKSIVIMENDYETGIVRYRFPELAIG